ncbi:MAG: hypothetical protein JXR05_02005 [Flavobacteriaceae bacterium]
MKLALEFIDNNPFPFCGIYIKNPSPKIWAIETTRMKLDLKECVIYPCPGLEANSVSGVLILSKTINRSIEIGEHTFVQEAHPRLFIPENTQLSAALTNDEVDELFNKQFHFFHHQLGLIELKESLQWEEILILEKEIPVEVKKPSKGVRIPEKVLSYSIEIEQQEEEGILENPFGEGINPEDLPFNMKKVLEGNNKEVKKYLAYLQRNPEAALKMPIPLDMMGTARGKAYAKLKFGRGLFNFSRLGKFKGGLPISSRIVQRIFIGFIMVIGIILLIKLFSKDTELPAEPLPDTSFSWVSMLVIPVIVVVLLLVYFISSKGLKKRGNDANWAKFSDDNELFEVTEKESNYYFGGNEITILQKAIILLFIILVLVYLFNPLIQGGSTSRMFALIIGITTVRMFYKLIRKDKEIFEDDR